MKTRKGIAFTLTSGTWANSPVLLVSLITMITPSNKRNHCSIRTPKSTSDGTAGTLIALVNPAHHSAIRAAIGNGSIPLDGFVATSLGPVKAETRNERLFKLAHERYSRGTWKIELATAETPVAETPTPAPSDQPAVVETSTPSETPPEEAPAEPEKVAEVPVDTAATVAVA